MSVTYCGVPGSMYECLLFSRERIVTVEEEHVVERAYPTKGGRGGEESGLQRTPLSGRYLCSSFETSLSRSREGYPAEGRKEGRWTGGRKGEERSTKYGNLRTLSTDIPRERKMVRYLVHSISCVVLTSPLGRREAAFVVRYEKAGHGTLFFDNMYLSCGDHSRGFSLYTCLTFFPIHRGAPFDLRFISSGMRCNKGWNSEIKS